MKVLLIAMLLFPGESVWEEAGRTYVTSHKECRMAQRLFRASYKAPAGFAVVTYCTSEEAPSLTSSGRLLLGLDQDPTVKRPIAPRNSR